MTYKCSYCKGEMEEGALKCMHCGEWTEVGKRKLKSDYQNKVALAFLASLLIVGFLCWTAFKGLKKIASTPTPPHLNATVVPNGLGIGVTNNEEVEWKGCEFSLNSKYKLKQSTLLSPHHPMSIHYESFLNDDGTRFNQVTTAPQDVLINCTV